MKKGENCKICSHKINFLGLFSENHSLIGSFSYREFLLHKKFGRAIFFSYREFSLTRSSLTRSFDCILVLLLLFVSHSKKNESDYLSPCYVKQIARVKTRVLLAM